MGIRYSFIRTSLLLTAITSGPLVTSAHANSFVISQAMLDWTGFSFSISEGLLIDSIVYSYVGSSTFAETSGSLGNSSSGTVTSFAVSSYVNSLGSAAAGANVNDGLLASSSESAAQEGFSSATADAFASTAFWIYGRGQGSLTVEVPYKLLIEAIVDQSLYDLVEGSASVSLQLGPGAGWYASESLSWTQGNSGGPMTRTGTLSLRRDFIEPSWGPLVYIGAGASTTTLTAVPEPSTLALLGFGTLSVMLARHRRFTP